MEDEVVGTITESQYWEWRTSIADMDLAKLKHELDTFKHQLLLKDQEILQLKIHLFKYSKLDVSENRVKETKQEYEKFMNKLEQTLGLSLKDCGITSNFEVIKYKK